MITRSNSSAVGLTSSRSRGVRRSSAHLEHEDRSGREDRERTQRTQHEQRTGLHNAPGLPWRAMQSRARRLAVRARTSGPATQSRARRVVDAARTNVPEGTFAVAAGLVL